MRKIASEKGDFLLFGLFMRADARGTWDLVVSAPWLEAGTLQALEDFIQSLSESIGEEQLKQLARFVILDETDPGVNAVLSAVSVDDGEVRVQRPDFFDLEIEDALILRAKRAA